MSQFVEVLKQARTLLERYRNETPLGHQPHMIAHQAEESIASLTVLIDQIEKAEPVRNACG